MEQLGNASDSLLSMAVSFIHFFFFFDRKSNFKWMWHNIKDSLEGMLLMEQKNLIQLGELYLACCKK